MCSISGWISEKPINKDLARDLATGLLYYGRERGKQSAGIAIGKTVLKRAIDPSDFVASKEFQKLFLKRPSKTVLLHTRYPTCGERTDTQAQPFTNENVTTVHNGYYFNIRELKETWNIQKSSGVDSELITDFVRAYGVRALPSFLASADGVSAIAAEYNKQLYLTRLGNPLSYVTTTIDGIDMLIFASTPEILLNALRYCVLVDGIRIKTLPEGVLFKASPTGVMRISKKFGKPQYTKDYYDVMDFFEESELYDG